MPQVHEGEVTEGEAQLGGRTYGVCLRGEKGWCLRLPDLDTSYQRVSRFAERLIGEYVDEEQLRYLAQDMLAAGYDCGGKR